MGGLFGGGSTMSMEDERIGSMRVQTSAYGGVLPLLYGTTRITGNLIWYGDFVAHPHTESSGGGKGGGGGGTSHTSYTYTASMALALCEGEIVGVPTVWKEKDKIVGGQVEAVSRTIVESFTLDSTRVIDVTNKNKFSLKSVTYNDPNEYQSYDSESGYYNQTTTILSQVQRDPIQKGTFQITGNGQFRFASADVGNTIYISYDYVDPSYYQSASDKAGLTLFTGALDQSVWSYLLTKDSAGNMPHGGEAIPYSGMAYVAAANYDLTSSASIQNHSFEIRTSTAISDSNPDAYPAVIINNYLSNPIYGATFPMTSIAGLDLYDTYTKAAGLFLSPALTEQEEAQEFIGRLMKATNSEVVWSEGKLKIVPYGDETLTGNGVTYTPDLTPLYDLTDDDFMSEHEAPIVVRRTTSAEAYNQIQVEYLDRASEYNTAIAEAKDQANIEAYGLRPLDPIKLHEICTAEIARHIAQLILQRSLYVRNTYEFRLGWKHCLLEPMDLVTLTDANLGFDKYPVRIVEIQEDETGYLSVIAEDWPFGIAGATKYPHQYTDAFSLDMNTAAGDAATPVIFETSSRVFGGRQELLIATAGTDKLWGGCDVWLSLDGTTYKVIGQITAPVRYGTLTTALPVGASPDSNTVVGVDLSISKGTLNGSTQADADAFATLCWVDGELIAYRDAVLKGSNLYDLGYILRAGYSTKVRAHAIGSAFVRLDDTVFSWEYPDELIGKQVYIKLTSFNAFGGGKQDLGSVQSYQYELLGKDNTATTPGTKDPEVTTDDNINISFDNTGNVIITFKNIKDPAIKGWELRYGDSDFETGKFLAVAGADEEFLKAPLTDVIGRKLWIKALYTSGGYSNFVYSCSFGSDTLPSITQVTSQINEPQINFWWPAVKGADHYIIYWEEGGVTTVRTLTDPQVGFRIPKYNSTLRIYAVNTSGQISKPYDQNVALTGTYNLNEIVNIPLSMATGQYLNMAFTSGNQVEKVSLLGPASFTTPIASPNNAGCYTFGYNLQNVAGSVLQNTPGAWFRQDFWYDGNGFYESLPVDLGQTLTGRLKLTLSKTVTAYGSGPGSAFQKVLGEYMANASGIDLTDTKAFLSAQFYVSDTMAGPWAPANDGDWVTTCRYVKITVKAEHISPLTDCLVTAGALTLDVPDVVETGSKTGVTSAGATVTLTKTGWHAVSLVLLTPKANCKVWPSNVNIAGGNVTFTINTDSASAVTVDYFVKGY